MLAYLPSMVSFCSRFILSCSCWLPFFLASSRPNVIPQEAGPSVQDQGAVLSSLSNQDMPLFYPGKDDEVERGRQNQRPGATLVGLEGGIAEPIFDEDNAPTLLARITSVRDAHPPPYVRQEPEISFVFDDITGDWEPYPTIFLPRPQRSAPTEQELRRSSRPRASPLVMMLPILRLLRGPNPRRTRKAKTRVPMLLPLINVTRHADNDDETTERPVTKKPKVKDVVIVSDDER